MHVIIFLKNYRYRFFTLKALSSQKMVNSSENSAKEVALNAILKMTLIPGAIRPYSLSIFLGSS